MNPRKPKELKEIEGTYRKDRDNLNPIASTVAIISTVPEELNEWGAKLWLQIDSDFSKIGVIKTSDVGSMLALCLEYGTMLEAYDLIAAQGLMVEVPIYSAKGDHVRDEWQVNPARKVASDAFKNYKSMCIEFGLTPVSRMKLTMPEQKTADEFEEFK